MQMTVRTCRVAVSANVQMLVRVRVERAVRQRMRVHM